MAVKQAKQNKKVEGVVEASLYDVKGKATGSVSLPAEIWNLPWNADLVHQVVTSMRSSARAGTAHTKDRGEVSGGGKKPWKQKGTGRARHGSRRSPIWRHGGITFGPRADKNYDRKVNVAMRRKALYTVLSQKLRDNEVLFLNDVAMKEPKTKDAKVVIESLAKIKGMNELATKKKNNFVLALGKKDVATEKSFRNFGNVEVVESRNLNPMDVLNYRYLVLVDPASFAKKTAVEK